MIAVYPGTFDPITNGHFDIIKRASQICTTLIVAVAENQDKSPMFSVEKRIEFIKDATKTLNKDIKIVGFSNLLVDFMRQNNVNVIIRGLRATSDFEYEFQLSCVNHRLDSSIETIFLPARDDMHFISSRTIKEIARLGGNISGFVPACVWDNIKR